MAIEDLRQRDWILLPGTLCTEDVFAEFLDALDIPKARRKPIVLSNPAVDDYTAVLTSCASGAVLCGFSLGAIVAAHNADRCAAERVVLFALNPYSDDPAKAPGRRQLAQDVAARGGARALAAGLSPPAGPASDRVRAIILSMADAAAPNIEAQTSLALTRPGALDALSRTASPVLLLTGSEDRMTPPAQGRAAAQAAPKGQFRLLPGLGHYALLEDPMACAGAVLDIEGTLP